MMNHLVLLLSILAAAATQRPNYAGSGPIGIPKLASRFANTSTTTAPTTSDTNLSNRVGTNGSPTTTRIPTAALGDVDLVKRVETWPRENQPFWYLNAGHVEKQKHPDGVRNAANVPAGNSGLGNSSGSVQVPVNNQNESVQSGVSAQTTVNDGDNSAGAQFNRTRGSFDTAQGASGEAGNSFSVFRGNKLKTYVYDPISDSWIAKTKR